jgi:hypothetical protein
MRKRDILLVGITGLLGLAVGLTSPTLGVQAEASASLDGGNQVTICHQTHSAHDPGVVITVNEHALPAHLAHGDYVMGPIINPYQPVINAYGPPPSPNCGVGSPNGDAPHGGRGRGH